MIVKMVSRKKTGILSLLSLLSLMMGTEAAQAGYSLVPRLSADVYASDYTVGQLNLILPLQSDYSHNLYLAPSLVYGSDNQAYGDLGLGYRWVQNKAAILGLYLFGGYTRTDNNARLWVANPGIEALGSRWDAHLNVYFPMGDRHYAVANDTGAISSFTGHSQIVNSLQITQYVGNGGDVKFSYQLFSKAPLKAYLGSYFFSPQTGHIWGGATHRSRVLVNTTAQSLCSLYTRQYLPQYWGFWFKYRIRQYTCAS